MNYISTEFQIQYLPYYTLYILCDHREELLLVKDDADKVQVLLRYPGDAPTAEACKILALPFREVFVVLPQQCVTFVPREVYREEDRELYAEYLMNKNDLDVQSVDIEAAQITALFQYDSILWQRWRALYPEAQFVPVFIPLFDQVDMGTSSSGSRLLIHVDGDKAHFLLVRDGEFKFYNTFHIASWEDIAYYTLKVAKSSDLMRFDEILWSGIASEEYMERLRPYADKMSMWEPARDDGGLDLARIPNLNLIFNSRTCVS